MCVKIESVDWFSHLYNDCWLAGYCSVYRLQHNNNVVSPSSGEQNWGYWIISAFPIVTSYCPRSSSAFYCPDIFLFYLYTTSISVWDRFWNIFLNSIPIPFQYAFYFIVGHNLFLFPFSDTSVAVRDRSCSVFQVSIPTLFRSSYNFIMGKTSLSTFNFYFHSVFTELLSIHGFSLSVYFTVFITYIVYTYMYGVCKKSPIFNQQ